MNLFATFCAVGHRARTLRKAMIQRVAGVSEPRDDIDVAHLRAIQLDAIDRCIPTVMMANVIGAVGIAALTFHQHRVLLPSWCAVVILVSGFRFVLARRSNGRPRTAAARGAIRRQMAQSGIMAVVSAGVPAWLLTQTGGLTFATLLAHLVGSFWGGSMVLSTVFPAAMTFVSLILVMTIGALASQGLDIEHVGLAIFVWFSTAIALRSARERSGLFMASQRQKLDLEKQGDVISILLKDYEEQTSDWLWEVDETRCVRNPSPRFVQALARSAEDVAGARFDALLSHPRAPGNAEGLADLLAHDKARRSFRDVVLPVEIGGDVRWWSVSGRPMSDKLGRFIGYRGVSTDITATRIAQERIAHLAKHDALTDLPNRSSFCEALDRALKPLAPASLAIISLDLDGFKPVNDRYGHPVGDALLVAVAHRLRDTVDPGNVVARFGGDEFLVLHDRMTEIGAVEALCHRLIERMVEPFEVLGERVTIGASVGVAFAPGDGNATDELIRNADAALYRAKGEGRGTFRFFEPEMDQRLQDRQILMQDLRSALARDELVLHFQPFVSADSGTVTGCEALIRWQHPTRGMVSPAEFIPIAEESGLIVAIGAWVVAQACLEAARWPERQRVSVNISPVQFHDRSLPSTILAALTRAGLSPDRLEVEVTETVFINDSDTALDILRQIRALGVRVALDDFGTGYSSLSYLRSFPFDKVKIDRSFVQDLTSRRDNQIIVKAIRDLARGLSMSITAEGVETEQQAEQLRNTGCEELQGYLFSRPISAHQLAMTFNRPVAQAEAAAFAASACGADQSRSLADSRA